MVVYTFDNTLDGLLSAVFDAFYNHEMPNDLLTAGKALPLFCDHIHEVNTDENKSKRVWKGLENKLTHLGLSIITISFLSEDNNLNYALFSYICKAFTNKNKISIEKNFSDPDVLICAQTYDQKEITRITFSDSQKLPFNYETGKMDADILSDNDKMIQDLWKTYFKAICIKERLNPKKQAGDMPRRYWRYMTEKQN